ncbi:MinD/ParA family protein [Oceanicoccus sp. KOV_DT_Chl]|uniref:MinD/ParA family protein n=1 Tax=Oceanicoccus sp. KOV_DT_Chl TaxID=1904639 RepID=UPI001F232F15|nr:MinD/ParA family protein [Oceanicoccus sp. KOV_DT_Chl]
MQKAQPQQPEKDTHPVMPRVIAISSGKGGVGKSSIAVNLGISLAKAGARVCLLDADTGLANTNILLGLTPQYSLEHVLYGAKAIEDVMVDGPHGLKIIPGANGISECVSLHPRQQLRLTRELARIEGDFDFLLIDTSAGIAEGTLDFVSAAQHALVVITPEPTSLTDAFSLIKLLKRRRGSIHYHVVVNMCSSASQAKEVFHRFGAAVEKYIGVQSQYLGFILRDESMRAAVVLQNPVAMFPDDDPSSRSFVKLADKLDSATADMPVTGTFSAYWHRQFKDKRGQEVKPRAAVVAAPTVEESAEARDNDYLSELRSRLLLMIEQGHTEAESIQSLLAESIAAFIKRFEFSPVELLTLVEQVVHSPERDDQLLREVAERVRPWSGLAHSSMMDSLSLRDLPVDNSDQDSAEDQANAAAELPLTPMEKIPPALDFELVDELPSVEPSPTSIVANDNNSVAAAIESPHQYDSSRFGSQSNLLDILQRQQDSDQPLTELLDSFL